MKSSVTEAVATPRSTEDTRAGRVRRSRQGRPSAAKIAPAQTSRSQAAPSGPTRSIRPTEAASPIWTQSIDVVAMATPERARPATVCEERVQVATSPVKTIGTLRVHVR